MKSLMVRFTRRLRGFNHLGGSGYSVPVTAKMTETVGKLTSIFKLSVGIDKKLLFCGRNETGFFDEASAFFREAEVRYFFNGSLRLMICVEIKIARERPFSVFSGLWSCFYPIDFYSLDDRD